MVHEIKWTKRARLDLRNIYDFIAKDSARYAQIQIEAIQNSAANLLHFPQMGHPVPEFPQLPYREILVGNYRVIYKIIETDNRIAIMAVVHGRRKLENVIGR